MSYKRMFDKFMALLERERRKQDTGAEFQPRSVDDVTYDLKELQEEIKDIDGALTDTADTLTKQLEKKRNMFKKSVLLQYKTKLEAELKLAKDKEKTEDRKLDKETKEQKKQDFGIESDQQNRQIRTAETEDKESDGASDREDSRAFDGTGLSEADIETARIAAHEMIYNERLIDNLAVLHDEGYERSAIEAARLSKTFLNDLNSNRLTADKRTKNPPKTQGQKDKKITLFPAKKNEFYVPGVLSVGQKTAVMVLSSSMAVVYHTKDIANSFPPGTAAELKTMKVDERGVEAYTKKREQQKEEEEYRGLRLFHGKPV